MLRVVVVLQFVLAIGLASAQSTEPPQAAQIERSAAMAAAQAQAWDKAFAAADKAVALAPKWPEAYHTRAGVRVAAAGADGKLEALKKPVTGVDYARIAKLLAGASADLKTYAELAPQAGDVRVALELVGELRVRSELATQAAKAPLRAPRCAKGQELVEGRCRGRAICSRAMTFDAKSETCRCMEGLVAHGPDVCCWPGQAYSAKTKRCVGTPECENVAGGFYLDSNLSTCLPSEWWPMDRQVTGRDGAHIKTMRSYLPSQYLIETLGLTPPGADQLRTWKDFFARFPLPSNVTWNGRDPGPLKLLLAPLLMDPTCGPLTVKAGGVMHECP
ncbi:MAG TPA: hypothetical protein VM513_20620 [Kofleriaceae bacterium]|jgi:hypothetical protein|nr:hypothetical protein [Kofleriaceae bacterium]